MTNNFRDLQNLPSQLNLIQKKKNVQNEKVAFRDKEKWIRVDEFGPYFYKENYDLCTPFKKVSILKNERRRPSAENIRLTRIREKLGTSDKKVQNLRDQLIYVKEEFLKTNVHVVSCVVADWRGENRSTGSDDSLDEQQQAVVTGDRCAPGPRGAFSYSLEEFNLRNYNDAQIQTENVIELESRLEKFNLLSSEFNDFQNEIEVLCDEGDLEIQYQMRSDFEDDYFSQLSTSKKIINEFYRLKDEQCNVHVAPSVSGGNVLETQNQLAKFWELEELPAEMTAMSADDIFCENLFVNTTFRDNSGRFVVTIPLKESPTKLDDLLSGASSEAEAVQLCNEVSDILSGAGFHLRKFNCNSRQVLSQIENPSDCNMLSLGTRKKTKTLGLYWSCEDDTLTYKSRVKWKYTQDKLKEGMLVLVKDKNTHSLCWRLGRVTIVHRGPDGIARVATIRTADGEIKRSFSTLCPLPVTDNCD
ncbi:hypothetical protein NQ317_009130 [Molorchus minor]|uniref:DUF5641 domain-containing protein n=1 Tax=Molorchus minor TaxID=1323400 RepID=A0ABQ9J034_9CUCU|nr:hypothetical protein NQ317_009130 [Molorchus minor]